MPWQLTPPTELGPSVLLGTVALLTLPCLRSLTIDHIRVTQRSHAPYQDEDGISSPEEQTRFSGGGPKLVPSVAAVFGLSVAMVEQANCASPSFRGAWVC